MSSNDGNGRVINADEDPDGVSAALGLDDALDEDPEDGDTGDGGDDEGGDDDGPTLADVLAELRELKRDTATLKRETAARRVEDKSAPKGKAADVDGEGETPDQAAARGREEARLEFGLELAEASIRTALTGIIPDADLDDFVDDLKLERYVGDDGKPDRDAIKALRERQAKITRRRPASRAGHGRQGGSGQQKSKSEQLSDTLASLGL